MKFDNDKGDIIVSNPPFSKSKDVMYRLKELDIQELEDILRTYPESGFEAKAKTTPKKTVKVKGGGMIRKFASGGAALRGFGKVIKYWP